MLTVDLARLGLRPGDWLLDAGCGGGRHCFGALDRGAHVVGLDLDVPSLRIARAGIHERRGRAEAKLHGGVLRGDVFRLPFPDGAFDRAICSEVMEHVHDYTAAARELARVVRPGGTLGVTIPTAVTEWLYWLANRRYFESPGDTSACSSPGSSPGGSPGPACASTASASRTRSTRPTGACARSWGWTTRRRRRPAPSARSW